MELSNEVYTTSSANFGVGFAFPQIDFALKGIEGDEPSDLDAEGLGHPKAIRVSYIGGAPIEQDEDGAEVLTDGDDTGGSELIAEDAGEPSGFIGLEGFDPLRASELSEELGEELVSLARKIAEELGAGADPVQFLAELRARQVELTTADRDVLDRSRRLGALADPETEAASVLRLADHGEANLRLVEGELMLVPAGADPALVAEAARRSREAREGKALRQAREEIVSEVFATVAGGPASLEALTGRLGSAAVAKDLLRELVRGGEISCRKAGERVILGEMGMSATDAHPAASVAQAAEQASYSNMKESARRARKRGSKAFPAPMVPFGGTKVDPDELPKVLELERARTAARDSGRTEARVEHPGSWDCEVVAGPGGVHVLPVYRREVGVFLGVEGAFHCWPVSETIVVNDPEGFYANQLEEEQTAAKLSRRAVRRTEAPAADVPADKLPETERESGPDQRGASAPREYRDSDRGGEALLASKGATNPSRTDRQRKDAQRRVNRALAKGKVSPSQRAWNTALAIHLSGVEDPAERLELMLQTKGRQEWKKLEKGSSDPAELKTAARQLADAGRLKALRHRQSGSLHIEAVAELSDAARKELERALLRLMVTGRVPVPKDTRLARRVAAHRGVLRREARKKEGTA